MKLHRTLLWICLLSLLMNTIPVAALSPSNADLQVTSADIWGMTAGQDHLRHIFIDCHLDDSSELPALEAEPLNTFLHVIQGIVGPQVAHPLSRAADNPKRMNAKHFGTRKTS